MRRVIAVAACGLALSACNAGFMQGMPSLPALPRFDTGSFFGPQPITVRVDSNPAGAEATAPAGGSCRTPCSLVVKTTGDFTVHLALAGYQPQAVPVKVLPPEDARLASEGGASGARLEPEQVFADLKPVEPARRTGGHPPR